MYERKLPVEVECGLHLFMEVLNGKWKIKLIWCIHLGINRPGELQRQMPKASRRLLDTHLAQLVEHGILSKITYDQKPFKAEYTLTALGETLIPVIESTAKWGETHREVLEPLVGPGNKADQ
ncbi:transcriptional regulator [Siphonobacter sp. BAB-5385]|uniref:winged helix-turn-helix transcriptional regulator n=1 Tax=Siphonobacter sp. BAB-5385 TaxID=1864822 RepID=UPI000B9E584F|nr:helix-turn-helix domain-containing protein [Siphonobacter sp. BAB-5385]OZI07913.1 transcriptional regulator [Siphonobacter sp. BAB-5385]